MQDLKKYIFPFLLLVFCVSFFKRNDFRNVTDIAPAVLNEPAQVQIDNPHEIVFSKYGYQYRLQPLYNYEINALVVGVFGYKLFSQEKYESAFPVDLCLIWGNNVSSGVFRNNAVQFSQDCRWCWVNWQGNINFNLNELSNNHILVKDDRVLSKLNHLTRGDQVKITGKLVNVMVEANNKPQFSGTWNTSVLRTDSDAGACEIIFAENIEVLKEANTIWRLVFKFSSYGIIVLILWGVAKLFMPIDVNKSQ